MRSLRATPKSTVFITVHKGASTFIAADFAAAIEQTLPKLRMVRVGSAVLRGLDYDDLRIHRRGDFFVRVYPNELAQLRGADPSVRPMEHMRYPILFRDPRDAAVSMYYSQAFSHAIHESKASEKLAIRQELTQMDLADGVERVSRSVIDEFLEVQRLREVLPDPLALRYEDLVTDYEGWLGEVRAYLGWSRRDTARIYQATQHAFDRPQTEDPHSHKRRVSPGNWQEVFDDRLRDLFESACGPQMRSVGYHW